MVRALAFRNKVLSLANTCSIGLRSGLYGGRKISLAPAAWIALRMAFVAAEIVHHDNVAGAQRWHQKLLDIGAEADRVDRLVEQTGRGDAVASQSRNEGQGLAMAMRHFGDQTLADRAAAMGRRHVCLCPGFVNENKLLGSTACCRCCHCRRRRATFGRSCSLAC